jgi:hypothetical protein
VVVAAAVLLGACDGGSSASTLEDTSTTSLAGPTTAPQSTPTTPPPAGPSTTVADDLVELSIVGGEVLGGPREVDVAIGEEVVLIVSSDIADELHVHGYDLAFDLEPGVATEVRFVADVPGIFEIELHESGALVAEITVS